MSVENVETVRNIYEGIRQMGGATALFALPDATRKNLYDQLFDPELEIRQSAELVLDTVGTFYGYEGFIDCTRELVEGLGDIQFDPGQAYESGDTVVFEVRALATGKESGVPVQGRLAHLWELKNGRVRRWVVYPTLAEALEAAGLSE